MDGPIDDLVIIRYAHTYDSFGGVSEHLRDLNKILLGRNRMKIYQIFPVAGNETRPDCAAVPMGRGTLVRVPIYVATSSDTSRLYKYKRTIRSQIHKFLLSALGEARLGSVLRTLHFRTTQWIDYTQNIPIIGALLTRNLATSGRFGAELAAITKRHSGEPILYVDHFPSDPQCVWRLKRARQLGLKTAIQHHGEFPSFLKKQLRFLSRGTHAGGVTLNNHQGALGPEPMRLGNGIDVEFFDKVGIGQSAALDEPNTVSRDPVILVPARVVRMKGQLDLVKAVALLRDKYGWQGAMVNFAGDYADTAYREILDSAIEEFSRSPTFTFNFRGNLERDPLKQAYCEANIVVLPSYSEGLPRVVLEAQAMGVPVVATDVGGTQEAIYSSAANRLFPVGNIAEMAAAINETIHVVQTEFVDWSDTRKFITENYSLDALAIRHEQFYQHAMT